MTTDGVGGGVAEDLFGAAVKVDDALRLVDGDDCIGRDGKDAGEFRLGGLQRRLRAPLLIESRANV